MKIGIIGTGNMGKILIQSLVESEAISPSQLFITNRNLTKAREIQKEIPLLTICETVSQTIKSADLIFLCVKPLDMHPILFKHNHLFTAEKCLVSITSPVSVTQLESVVDCSCARLIPSITNRVLSGVSLLSFSTNCWTDWKEILFSLAEKISTPVEIDENITRVSSDIVSCGPAFFSYITQRFIDGAVEETKISKSQATLLASQMLIGLGELLKKNVYTLPSLQEKVCVKGGVTGEGIKVLESEIGDMFQKVFRATHEKFEEDLSNTKKQFKTY
ncbi:late competence protein ComER [Bacillus sp. 2205SS5-2]|uniref:late competence protein ComER n=1 Tax=Bacillus sp. 2205SS5-2 TaxID=3109031 RepID=UPI0030051B18